MAGSSTYPTSVDNKTALQDGVDYMEADNVNNAYVPINSTQTFIGANGKGASWSSDILDYLANKAAPLCTKTNTTTISVSAGVVFIKNSGQANRLMRRNTSATSVSISDLDTGTTVSANTYYYIYAVADTAATTFTVKISTSATAPTGLTNFELIGWFFNEASGSVLEIPTGYIGNVKGNGRDVPNKVIVTGTTDISSTSTSYVDITGMVIRMRTNGRPLKLSFFAPLTLTTSDTRLKITFTIATVTKTVTYFRNGPGDMDIPGSHFYIEDLAAGTYTLSVQWLVNAITTFQNGSTIGARQFIAEEI